MLSALLERTLSPGQARLRRLDRWRPEKAPYAGHIRADVVLLDNGGLMVSWGMPGRAFEVTTEGDRNSAHERLHTSLLNMAGSRAGHRLSLWHHLARVPAGPAPAREYRSAFARDLDAKYRAGLAGRLYENRLYLSLILRPELDAVEQGWEKTKRTLGLGRPAAVWDGGEGLPMLDEAAAMLERFLEPYGARRLGLARRDGYLFSEPAEMLRQVAYAESLPVPLVDGHLGGSVLSERLIFGREVIELRGVGGSRFAGILSVKEYATPTRPGMWDGLLRLPFPLVMSQSFVFLDRLSALGRITRKQNQMRSAEDGAMSLTEEMTDARDELMTGAWAMGDHHMSVMVLADDAGALAGRLAQARNALTTSAMVMAREDVALESAYWAQFPGNGEDRTRPAAVTTRNFAGFAPLRGYPAGQADGNHWGEALALLETTALTPVHLSLHVGDLGHTFICGRTGTGKTALLDFLLARMEAFGVRRVFFDYKRGAEIFIRASGGVYLDFAPGRPTGCAPFKGLDLTDARDMGFIRRLMRAIGRPPGGELSVTDENALDGALAQMARHERADLDFDFLIDMLSQDDENGMAARLKRWARGGTHGWVLDNDQDVIRLDEAVTGFDITSFIDDPEIRAPLILYLLYRVERALDGSRTVVSIDEAWKALADPFFAEFAEKGLRTFRRLEAPVILGTQDPQDAEHLPLGRLIISQMATRIFLPDNKATLEVYGVYGLGPEHVHVIRNVLSSDDRTFLVVQDGLARVCRLDLSGLKDEMAVLSGTEKRSALLDRIRADLGDDPDVWLPEYRRWYRTPEAYVAQRKETLL